jgi:hypothetical protein
MVIGPHSTEGVVKEIEIGNIDGMYENVTRDPVRSVTD